jgi:MFS family permease
MPSLAGLLQPLAVCVPLSSESYTVNFQPARLHDVVGRRKMLMGSCIGMSIALAIVAATTAEYEKSGSVPASSASIAFIFIFGVIFAVAFTPMQPIYPAEVLSSKI